MAKQGQHSNDANDNDKSKGPNNPDKSVKMATGTPKKQDTYREQASRHKNPAAQAQAASNEWNEDTRGAPSIENRTRARDSSISSGRSGSNSGKS